MAFVVVRDFHREDVINAMILITAGRNKVEIAEFLKAFGGITSRLSLAGIVDEDLGAIDLKERNRFLENSIAFRLDGGYIDFAYGVHGPRNNCKVEWDSPSRSYN